MAHVAVESDDRVRARYVDLDVVMDEFMMM